MRRIALAFTASLACVPAGAAEPDTRFVGSEYLQICDVPNGTRCLVVRHQPVAITGRGPNYSLITLPDGRSGWVETTRADRLPVDAAHARAVDGPDAPSAIGDRCERLGGVKIGMTPAQAKATCWGSPRSVNATTTAYGRHEQWIYRGGYLYFDNGILTSVQTSSR